MVFRTSPHDEHFSLAMFDFLKEFQARRGVKIPSVGIVHEDTLFGADSAKVQEELATKQGYQVAGKLAYRARSTSLVAEVQRLKAANPAVLLPTSYTSDAILIMRTARELDYNPPMILAQDAGFIESDFVGAVGKDAEGIMSRSVFSLDLVQKRPVVGKVNELYRKKHGKDLNDNTSRAFTGMLVLAEAINRAGSTAPTPSARPSSRPTSSRSRRSCRGRASSSIRPPARTSWGRRSSPSGAAAPSGWLALELAAMDVLYPLPKWSERK